ncbi:MAG: glycosyltransferase family 39 protein [Acidimicrobiales bacterium]|nr:glycosyltransferase family 39 protein [Acidimicrobiales bacterium]
MRSDGEGHGWFARHWYWLGVACAALVGAVIRFANVLVWYPTCAADIIRSVETGVRYPECPPDQFRVWGDSAYGFVQGYLLNNGHGFVDSATWYTSLGQRFVPSAGDPPLFAILLAALRRVGVGSATGQRLACAAVGVVGVVLIAQVARRVAGRRAGVIAAALAATYPLLWINDGMLLSESLFVPLIAVVLLVAYRFWDKPTWGMAAALGAAIAAAALTRGEALLLFGALVVPLLWGLRRVPPSRRGLLALTCWVVGGALIAPWVLYNLSRFSEPVFMTSQTGAVLSAGSCDVAFYGEAIGYYAADCYSEYVRKGYVIGHPRLPGCDTEAAAAVDAADPVEREKSAVCWPDPEHLDESERDQIVGELARRYIDEHRSRLPIVMAVRVLRMFDLYNPDIGAEQEPLGQNVKLNWAVEGRGKWQSELGFLMYWLLVPFGVPGIVILIRRRVPVSPLLAPVVVITVTAAFAFGVTRYRVPFEVTLLVAAAVALDALVARRWAAPDGGTVRERDTRLGRDDPAGGVVGAGEAVGATRASATLAVGSARFTG